MSEPADPRPPNCATRAAQAEPAIHDSGALMEMAQHIARFGYWRIDLPTKAVFWSAGIYEILGLPRSHIPVFERAIELYHPDDRATVTAALERCAAEDGPLSFEARIIHADGAYRHVSCSGRVERDATGPARALFGVFQDVTERTVAEAERLRLLERLKVATQAARIGIWEVDLHTDHLHWDAAMFALYGFAPDDVAPTYDLWIACLDDGDRERVAAEVRRTLTDGEPFDSEFRVVRRGGEPAYLRATATLVRDRFGVAVRLVGTNLDVTENRRLARQLEAAAARARETAATLREKIA